MNMITIIMADVTGRHLREKIVPKKAAITEAAVGKMSRMGGYKPFKEKQHYPTSPTTAAVPNYLFSVHTTLSCYAPSAMI